MHREDFTMLNQDIVFFDNGATTLKPKCVVEAMNKYYTEYTSNIHRGDYDAAIKTNELYDDTRNVVAKFLNCRSDEVIFTSGTTMSINMVVFGYMEKNLKSGDEVLLTKSEHASNILPWIKLSEKTGIVLKYMELDDNYSLTVDSVLKAITEKTKVISIAHVTNVIGDVRDISAIGDICRSKGILFCVDGAQSVPHMAVDFKNSNIDFLSFSGHKMCGPTGIGCLVVRNKYLSQMEPLYYGGGMNNFFESDGSYELKKGVTKFEAGTPPIAEVIGLREAILYLMKIGMDNIHNHEVELKKYLVQEMKKIKNIKIYNENSKSGILAFNIEGVFAQDSSVYLNNYNIYVRAGNHCAKMVKDEIGVKNTVRVSMYLYNTKEDVDKLIKVLKQSDDIFKIVI
ncbi:MAG: cysteine desulfurase [Mycoplasmatota bacterium]|nr:cysteine desulfurase [Mycoplasmatota bacterium]